MWPSMSAVAASARDFDVQLLDFEARFRGLLHEGLLNGSRADLDDVFALGTDHEGGRLGVVLLIARHECIEALYAMHQTGFNEFIERAVDRQWRLEALRSH